MKKILLAICLIFLFATCSFAGDLIFAPVIEKPAPDDMDIYIISNDRGRSEVVTVISLDPVMKDSYVILDSKGKSSYIMKLD